MANPWRLILAEANNGYYNMAADEAMLLLCERDDVGFLRIYGWNAPFVTLGYNQDYARVMRDTAFPFTRRLSGGAAIVHDQELTYSFACPRRYLGNLGSVKDSYRKICQFLIYFYLKLGLKAQFAEDLFPHGLGHYGNFCFATKEHCDLIVGGKKIGGNAQKRTRKALLQHGSIPLRIDFDLVYRTLHTAAGVEQHTTSLAQQGVATDLLLLQKNLIDSFREAWTVDFRLFDLRAQAGELVERLLAEKYLVTAWQRQDEKTRLAR